MKQAFIIFFLSIALSATSQVQKDTVKTINGLPVFDLKKRLFEIDSSGRKIYYEIDSLGQKLYTTVHIYSEFEGGQEAWKNFLIENLNPRVVRDKFKRKDIPEEGLKITAELRFTVCKDGSLCDFEVINDVHPAAKEEALRVIKLSPNWKPGLIDGICVKSKIRQKITFVLEK